MPTVVGILSFESTAYSSPLLFKPTRIMEQQFITLINDKIIEHYQTIKTLLLDKSSYKTRIDTQNVLLYFTFLEACLQKPYNRLNSASTFIGGDDGQLTDKMYPFALLNEEAKASIKSIFSKAVALANTLEVSGIDPEFVSLCEEELLCEAK